MTYPINLEQADAEFGIERVYKHRRKKESHRNPSVYLASETCLDCGKYGYRSEEAARIIIGRMIRNHSLRGPDAFCFRPYLCPHGWWHVGHDPRSRRMFQDLPIKSSLPVVTA